MENHLIAGTAYDRRRKLTPEQREELRKLRAKFGTPYAQLAKQFGVSTRLAHLICNPEAEARVHKQAAEHHRKSGYTKKLAEAQREYRARKQQLIKEKLI